MNVPDFQDRLLRHWHLLLDLFLLGLVLLPEPLAGSLQLEQGLNGNGRSLSALLDAFFILPPNTKSLPEADHSIEPFESGYHAFVL